MTPASLAEARSGSEFNASHPDGAPISGAKARLFIARDGAAEAAPFQSHGSRAMAFKPARSSGRGTGKREALPRHSGIRPGEWFASLQDFGVGLSSFVAIADLKPRMLSPRPLPNSGSFLGPKTSRAIPAMTNKCMGWNRPSNMNAP